MHAFNLSKLITLYIYFSIARPYTCLILECSTDVGAGSHLHVHVPRAEGDGQPSGAQVGTLLASGQSGLFSEDVYIFHCGRL